MLENSKSDSRLLIAKGLTVVGEEGTVFGPLDLELPDKKLVFLSGRDGSGKTALALTLSGRMRPTEGSLEVFGVTKRTNIRDVVAVAGVDAIDEIDRNLTVRDVLNEHRQWSHGWYKWVAPVDDAYRDRILCPVYGDRSLPSLDLYISQLSNLDRILIRIAISLMPFRREPIQMLVLNDLEQVRELIDRMVLIDMLHRLSEKMLVIVNSVSPPPAEIFENAMVIPLFTDQDRTAPQRNGLRNSRLGLISRKWVLPKGLIQREMESKDESTSEDTSEDTPTPDPRGKDH